MSAATANPARAGGADAVLSVRDLFVDIRLRKSVVHAVSGIDLEIGAGERLGLVGESGCGKSTLGLALAGLLPDNAQVRGSIRLGGEELVGAHERALRQVRGARVGVVFQDPMTSLNPTKRIGDQVGEALRLHGGVRKEVARRAALEMLELVGLPRPKEQIERFPHELSGGMRQRCVIAAALICQPRLLVADEPTTALDVTTQSQILDLFDRLRDTLGMALLLVTHDMGVVAEHTDRVLVMYAGREVELGGTRAVFSEPCHRYTEALLASVIRVGGARGAALSTIPGLPPDLSELRAGCDFAPRCSAATERCAAPVDLVHVAETHRHRCAHPAAHPDASGPSGGDMHAGMSS